MWVKLVNGKWTWQGDWLARSVFKFESSLPSSYNGQVLQWNTATMAYQPTAGIFVMNEILDKDPARGDLQQARQALTTWRTFALQHHDQPIMNDLASKATNIIEILDDEDDDEATVVVATFNGAVYGVSVYEITDRDHLVGLEVSDGQPAKFLYSTYWVAHPSTQAAREQRAQGAIGGVGKAMRMWAEFQAHRRGLRVLAHADNVRSYIVSLRDGYLDDGPIDVKFPPEDAVVANFALT
jgi:hypothetical protein